MRDKLESNMKQVQKNYYTLQFQSRPVIEIQEKPLKDTDAVQLTSTSEILLLTDRQ